MIDFNKVCEIDGANILKLIAIIIFVTVLLVSAIWCAHYRYVDCLKVGHTKTYCIITIGK